jgi:small subunit ribosomal protein S20
MPNSPSAKKRLRQSIERRDRNRAKKSAIRTAIRAVREAVQAGDVAKADEAFKLAAKRLDRAGAQRVLHPNKTSRLKSRLSAFIKKAKQPAAA